MFYPTTRVCLTCKRDLPLTAFRTIGRRDDGEAYLEHDCKRCMASPFAKRGPVRPPLPPKAPGECILRECHEPVSAADSEGVLCAAHLVFFRPHCRCGCGREIEETDHEGYRPTCWLTRTPQGRVMHRARQAIRRRLEREDRARQGLRAAERRRAWLLLCRQRTRQTALEWLARHRLRMKTLRAEMEALGGRMPTDEKGTRP